ncbi:MAG: hypothetical protein KF812_03630 [Fimbriimonadaceae bacterium]|nr:hypothetical protein [Fimbriimonadaceae bacterium]
MAKRGLQVVGVRPSASETATFLANHLKSDWIVTAFDDARLRVARDLIPEQLFDEVEVAPLGDLAGRVLMMHGVPAPRIATRGQMRAAFAKVLGELPDDNPFSASAQLPGLAEQLAEEWPKWCHFGLTPESLRSASIALAGQERPFLAEHAASLAEIIDAAEKELGEKGRSAATQRILSGLNREPDANLTFAGLVVLGGATEHPVAERWCQWVADHGLPVVLALDQLASPSKLFGTGDRIASRLGKEVSAPPGDNWLDALFTEEVGSNPPSVALEPAFDALAECEWALRGALAKMKEGASPSECAIIVPSGVEYAPLASAAAQRLGVPLVAPLTVPLLTNGFARFIQDVMRAIVGDDVRDWGRVAKRSYIGHQPLMWTALDQAIRSAFAQDGQAYEALAEWVTERPQPYGWLGTCLQWREDHRLTSMELSEWINQFRNLIGDAGLAEVAGKGEGTAADRDRNAMTALQRPLADEATLYGNRLVTLEQFVSLALTRWEQETVTIPARTDGGVSLVQMNAALSSWKYVWVLGMLEGTIPSRRRENALMSDRLIHQLNAQGIALPDSHESAREERDRLARICASAEVQLTLSYPLENDDRDTVPTAYIDEVHRTAGVERHPRIYDRSYTLPPLSDCLALSDFQQREARQGTTVHLPIPRLNHPDAMDAVRPKPKDGIAIEVLDDAAECIFRATTRHLLGLYPTRALRHDSVFRGLPKKAELHAAPDQRIARERLQEYLESRLTEVMPDVEPAEASLMRRRGRRAITDWIDREFTARDMFQRGPASIPEIALGSPSLGLTLDTRAGEVNLTGKVAIVAHDAKRIELVTYVPSVERFRGVRNGKWEKKKNDGSEPPLHFNLLVLLAGAAYLPTREEILIELIGPRGQHMRVRVAQSGPTKRFYQEDLYQDWTLIASPLSIRSAALRYGTRAYNSLLDATMEARPGEHCRRCPYADLCRSATDIGDLGGSD